MQFFKIWSKKYTNRGMKVILDGVFNHCGSFNRVDGPRERIYDKRKELMNRVLLYQADSPYHDYFHFLLKDRMEAGR